MKFKKILHTTLNESEAQTRVGIGIGFESFFENTYDVDSVESHLKKANIEVRRIGARGSEPTNFPEMSEFSGLTIDKIEIISTDGSAFRLLKADFKNSQKNQGLPNIYNKVKKQEVSINGSNVGNLFELKTGSPTFKRKVMFSEHKKIATRDSFMRIFSNEETMKEWKKLSSLEKKKQWENFLKRVSKDSEQKIMAYNKFIEYIKNQLNAIKPTVKGSISRRIKNVLKRRGFFLVKGTKNQVKFYKIDIDKFIENTTYEITKWAGISRIKVDISPDMIQTSPSFSLSSESHEIKNNILSLSEDEIQALELVSVKINISVELSGESQIESYKEEGVLVSDSILSETPRSMISSTIVNV
jgi:hypothetical protein